MLRVVLDTNVFVSSLLTKSGATGRVVDAWRARQFLLLTSPAMIDEIQRVLHYRHIQHKYVVAEEDILALAELLQKDARVVSGQADVAGALPEDGNDEMVQACAVDGLADFIVSGDRHLLGLKEYRGNPVLTVHEFLERLTA